MRLIPSWLNPFRGTTGERVENAAFLASAATAATFTGAVGSAAVAVCAVHGGSRVTRWFIRLRRRVVPRSAQRMAAAIKIALGDGGEITIDGVPQANGPGGAVIGVAGALDDIVEDARDEANLVAAVAALSPRTAASPRARARLRLTVKAVRAAKIKYGSRPRTKANEEMVSDYVREWLQNRTDIRPTDIVAAYPQVVRAYFLEWDEEIAARHLDASSVAEHQREQARIDWRPSMSRGSTAGYSEVS